MSAAPLFFHGSFVCRSEPLAIESCKQLQQWLQKKTSDETIVFFDFRPWPKGPCLTSDFLIKLRKIVLIFSLQRLIENVIELEKPLEFGDLRVDNWVVYWRTPQSYHEKHCFLWILLRRVDRKKIVFTREDVVIIIHRGKKKLQDNLCMTESFSKAETRGSSR